jgi:hypothetical protein
MQKATGNLGIASTPTVIPGTLKVKDHAFHGQ